MYCSKRALKSWFAMIKNYVISRNTALLREICLHNIDSIFLLTKLQASQIFCLNVRQLNGCLVLEKAKYLKY